MSDYSLALPCALGLNRMNAVFRQKPEDFVVTEELGFDLTGEGEHLWVQVEKIGMNTMDVVRQLARMSRIREKDIGFAGLKDKHAVASQWFSLPGAETLAAPEAGREGSFRITQQVRNQRKLRRGSHRGNGFVITLRDITVSTDTASAWQQALATQGCPNYFGPQRFGHDGSNLDKAARLFAGELKAPRHQRGMYLSAARAFLFNQVLAARIEANHWNAVLDGDVMALQGSGSVFAAEPGDAQLPGRLAEGDIHVTGPLWGAGQSRVSGSVQALESGIAERYQELAQGLVRAGLAQERRALRVMPEQLCITPAGEEKLVIEFSLPSGAYATSVLREMVIAEGL